MHPFHGDGYRRTTRRAKLGQMLYAVFAALVSLAPAARAEDPPTVGEVIYRANCTACHGRKGDGKGPAAVAIRPRPTDFTQSAFWKDRTDASVVSAIRAGKPGTAMTAFPQLTEQEAAQVTAYLRTLVPKP